MSSRPIPNVAVLLTATILLLLTAFELSFAVTASNAQSNTPTPSPIRDFGPTPQFHLTPSPTPHLMETDVQTAETCVPISEDDPPQPAEDFLYIQNDPERHVYPVNVLAFLNAGGSVDTIIDLLPTVGTVYGPYMSQVVVQDVVGDAVPEIFLAVTIPILMGGEYGDSFLFMLECVDAEYTSTYLFIRRGGGPRSEGLYQGGGVRIVAIDDWNANGRPEIFYGVNWYWSFSDRYYVEYGLFEFDDDGETTIPLFYVDDPFSDNDYLVTGSDISDIQFRDDDEDGIYDILIGSHVFAWNGQYFVAKETD